MQPVEAQCTVSRTHHGKLVDVIHGRDAIDAQEAVKPRLPDEFGAIPLAMYLNAARNLRPGMP